MVRTFPFEFLTHRPSGDLRQFVETIWYARGRVPYQRERIAPTGSSVAVFVLGDPILETPDDGEGEGLKADRGFLLGPHARPVVNEPLGETFAVGIVTTPVGCETVFGISPVSVRASVVDLEEAWPSATTLRAALMNRSTASEMVEVVEATLHENLRPVSGVELCARAVGLLEKSPTRPIGEIADELAVSHSYLDRRFTQIAGLSPRTLARILRMRALLATIDVGAGVDWAHAALELGWFDQSHLIRDFKRHTGVTPSTYVAVQKAYIDPDGPGEHAGFVPDL